MKHPTPQEILEDTTAMRDDLAKAVMSAILRNGGIGCRDTDVLARQSYHMADAMLRARKG